MKAMIHTDGLAGWAKRARARAQAMDEGRSFPASVGITFESAAEMAKLLTPKRIQLVEHVRKSPGFLRDVAATVGRDERAVSRDIAALSKYGIVRSEWVGNPGHGRARRITAPDSVTISARF